MQATYNLPSFEIQALRRRYTFFLGRFSIADCSVNKAAGSPLGIENLSLPCRQDLADELGNVAHVQWFQGKLSNSDLPGRL
jgi:hypothetical protein